MTHNVCAKIKLEQTQCYLFSDDIYSEWRCGSERECEIYRRIKSPDQAPLFSLKGNGCVWLRGSGRVHLKIWSPYLLLVRSDSGHWTLIWNCKRFRGFLYDRAPCNHGDARRTLNYANKLRRVEAAYDFWIIRSCWGLCRFLWPAHPLCVLRLRKLQEK